MAATSELVAASWALSGLDDLLHRLRRAGLRVGTGETLDAARLLKALAQHRPDIKDESALKAPLRAVLCKSATQQRQFDPVFDEWARQRLQIDYRQRAAPDEPVPASAPLAAPPRRARWLWGALGIVIALGVAFPLSQHALHVPSQRGTDFQPIRRLSEYDRSEERRVGKEC